MSPTTTVFSKVAFIGRPWPVPLGDLPTPLLAVDRRALDHNVEAMAAWCRRAGVDLAPHGKTTMAPEIWRQQIAAGAWGITVATPYQAAIAREAGIERVILAGTTFAPDALRGLVEPGCDVVMWVDSVEAVRIVDGALGVAGASRKLPVLVEVGATGARTGVRTIEAGLDVARAVRDADHLVLAGVAGYEAALSHDIDGASLQRVDDYLATLIEFRDLLDGDSFAEWLALGGDVVITAGGSTYFDRVVEALSFRHDPEGVRGVRTRVVLRSGSYVTHDHGHYDRVTPFGAESARVPEGVRFEPALTLWASVLSRPEPGLALLNIGRRDTSDDEGFPVLLEVHRRIDGGFHRVDGATEGAVFTGLNDQHAFVRVPEPSPLEVGDLVRLGISHPCTTLDRWSEIAAFSESDLVSGLPVVDGVVATRF
ncbi:alanine racemase [Frondihabitans cladoniiphilus]|uniref:Amino acid deaminase n=1 Tax=Frondihabitans cladoniiphilus TaxID=715785 RepID=A0ABP8VVZ7_9MICO